MMSCAYVGCVVAFLERWLQLPDEQPCAVAGCLVRALLARAVHEWCGVKELLRFTTADNAALASGLVLP